MRVGADALSAAGAVVELAALWAIERRPGVVTEAFTTGRSEVLRRTAELLTLGGAVTGLTAGRRSRIAAAAAAAGLFLLAGSALMRFSTFQAGVASTRDPKYTVLPQRERLNAQSPR